MAQTAGADRKNIATQTRGLLKLRAGTGAWHHARQQLASFEPGADKKDIVNLLKSQGENCFPVTAETDSKTLLPGEDVSLGRNTRLDYMFQGIRCGGEVTLKVGNGYDHIDGNAADADVLVTKNIELDANSIAHNLPNGTYEVQVSNPGLKINERIPFHNTPEMVTSDHGSRGKTFQVADGKVICGNGIVTIKNSNFTPNMNPDGKTEHKTVKNIQTNHLCHTNYKKLKEFIADPAQSRVLDGEDCKMVNFTPADKTSVVFDTRTKAFVANHLRNLSLLNAVHVGDPADSEEMARFKTARNHLGTVDIAEDCKAKSLLLLNKKITMDYINNLHRKGRGGNAITKDTFVTLSRIGDPTDTDYPRSRKPKSVQMHGKIEYNVLKCADYTNHFA